ncbi:MAG TPA: BON domain-containing protein [Steroidobacteraceae bacterium]|nr:BON domain-containing protein [Steroidobacteraceae bacterium]
MTRRILATVATLIVALSVPTLSRANTTAGQDLDDSAITARVKTALMDNKNTHAYNIHVETYTGIVSLAGWVRTQEEKDAATHVAQTVSGVKEVRNQISLHAGTPFSTKVGDSIVTSRVKAALVDNKDVKSHEMKIDTVDGIVQLSGFVSSQAMKEKAAKVAASVSGVQSVDNQLIVRPE